ncbi:MAG: hypothetical protein LW841_13145, partial [Flammeovirgaceae bacterium]|nr:hypothetical protein [Flammeovirgaceae bacterium]
MVRFVGQVHEAVKARLSLSNCEADAYKKEDEWRALQHLAIAKITGLQRDKSSKFLQNPTPI